MFCPNCGERLESQNQKFCASCGSVLSYTPPDSPQPRVEENQVSSPVRSVPVYESKTIKVGGPGPHSKKCFAFAFVSVALAIVGYSSGGIFFIRNFLPGYFLQYYFGGLGGGLGGGPGGLIIAVVLNITGLIFGILSRVNTIKAGVSEPINALEQFGSVVAVFGIIMNAIPIVIVPLIFLVIPLMYMPMYYWFWN